jgi:hypothetical protein
MGSEITEVGRRTVEEVGVVYFRNGKARNYSPGWIAEIKTQAAIMRFDNMAKDVIRP